MKYYNIINSIVVLVLKSAAGISSGDGRGTNHLYTGLKGAVCGRACGIQESSSLSNIPEKIHTKVYLTNNNIIIDKSIKKIKLK